ncbi:MAG: glycerate kinase [Jatrophihabitans sp.]
MPARRVLLAPDKFKGSLTAAEVAGQLMDGIRSVVPGRAHLRWVPVADGGDGTVAAAISAGFTEVRVSASGPTGIPQPVSYAERDATAVIELAGVCGLQRLPDGRFEPMAASSYGVGEVVREAVRRGARRVVLGIGGSASTDGGAGLLQALGASIRDVGGVEVQRGGGPLRNARTLDLAGLLPALADVDLIVASDVDNPLLGPNGAAAVYGPQKGADALDVAELEAALGNWAAVVAAATGRDAAGIPGAGAAGGVGFGAVTLGATIRSGVALLLEIVGFDAFLAEADLVVTGEGSLDEQTLAGKAPVGVAAAARRRGVPVVAVAGRTTLSADQLAAAGFADVYLLSDLADDPDDSLRRAAELVRHLGAEIARDRLS